ncbi:MAG TPA: TldD/PmbA family protein [Methylomirabilota bacterium]|nr:TldD/PmbA family protein [Methylomirabilota bacterium]
MAARRSTRKKTAARKKKTAPRKLAGARKRPAAKKAAKRKVTAPRKVAAKPKATPKRGQLAARKAKTPAKSAARKPPAPQPKRVAKPAPPAPAPKAQRPTPRSNGHDLLDDLIARARKAGADAADAVLFEGTSVSLGQRLGKPEKLERAEGRDLGLRVFVGKKQAIVSSTDTSPAMLGELVERGLAMARSVPEDSYCGLADPAEIARKIPAVDLYEDAEPSADLLKERARQVEEAALAVKGVTNSEGAEASWGRSTVALAASNGFHGGYRTSRYSFGTAVLAGEGTGMERDYDYVSTVYGSDLEDPAVVGRRAGERAVKRLNPRKVATAKVPIVYDPRASRSLLSHLAGAINGASIARGTSFLKDKLGERIFGSDIVVIDDPHRPRGLNSKPFDGEGVANKKRAIIDKGFLTTWVLDLRSARQLGLKTTGHAARGTSSPPSPSLTNLYMEAGKLSPQAMIAGILSGFYVTELMGFGINGVTGDYSRGAAGFWIEHGEIAYPVSEVTIAGNLKDMFLNLTPADDLEFRHGMDAPTIRVDGMTVAGV